MMDIDKELAKLLNNSYEIEIPSGYRWDTSSGNWMKLSNLPNSSFSGSGLAWVQCSPLDVLHEVQKYSYSVSAVLTNGERRTIYPNAPISVALPARLQGEKDNPDLKSWKLQIFNKYE